MPFQFFSAALLCTARTLQCISCLNFWDEAWWVLSLRVFGLLSSSLLTIKQKFRQVISSRYGPDTIYQMKQLEKLNRNLARITNHLTFLCRCRDLKLVPPGLTIKIPVRSRRARKVPWRLEQEFVRDRIHNNRLKKHQLRLEISSKLTPFLGRVSMIDDRTRKIKMKTIVRKPLMIKLFRDSSQLRHYSSLNGLHAFKMDSLDDPFELW